MFNNNKQNRALLTTHDADLNPCPYDLCAQPPSTITRTQGVPSENSEFASIANRLSSAPASFILVVILGPVLKWKVPCFFFYETESMQSVFE
jgi:hypothetical protein